jgi:hypothetical protein
MEVKSMTIFNKSLGLVAIVTSLVLPNVSSFAFNLPTLETTPNNHNQISLGFPPAPSGQGKITTGTQGGGTRGNCLNKTVTPLIPSDQVDQTINGNPVFFAYLPENEAKLAEFVVMDTEGNTLYSQQYQLPKEATIARIKLTPDQPLNLETNQVYIWELSLVCQTDDRAGDAYVVGSFTIADLDQQQEKNLKQDLEKANSQLEKAAVYAKNNLWNETIEIMAEIKDAQPEEWQELLQSIGIEAEEIINSPILDLEPEK